MSWFERQVPVLPHPNHHLQTGSPQIPSCTALLQHQSQRDELGDQQGAKLPRVSPAALSEDHTGSQQSTSLKPLLEAASRRKTILSLMNSMSKTTGCVIYVKRYIKYSGFYQIQQSRLGKSELFTNQIHWNKQLFPQHFPNCTRTQGDPRLGFLTAAAGCFPVAVLPTETGDEH